MTNSELPTDDRDLFCLRCKYNLRGLPEDTNCPECGLSISHSSSPFADINPQSLLHIRNGCVFLLALQVAPALLAFFDIGPGDKRPLLTATMPIWHIFWAAGFWMISTPPGYVWNGGRLRQFVRALSPGMAVLVVILRVKHFKPAEAFIAMFLGVVSLIVLFAYLGKLATWTGNRSTATQSSLVAAGIFLLVPFELCNIKSQSNFWGLATVFTFALDYIGSVVVLSRAMLHFNATARAVVKS